MPIVVFFLDALDPRECVDWLANTKQGRVISGVPRVTPPVIGSFLTGKTPGEHALLRPTPLYKPFMQRPKGETIIDLVASRCRVLSYTIPFTMGVQPPNAIVAQSGMAGDNNIPFPALILPQVNFEPTGDDPELPLRMLQSYIDHTRNVCATIRQLIRNNRADVYFVSIREIDAFTHYFYNGDYRKKLIEYISFELEEFTMMGNDMCLFWFSDHGGCEKIGKFEMNRWFIDKGYLNITYLQKRHEIMMDAMEKDGDNKPFREQVGIHTPFVQIEDGTKFYSSDLFDACVDVMDATDDEIEKLRQELLDTGHFKAVHRKRELFGECDPDVPEIIPDRKDGLIVSANVHPKANEDGAETVVNFRSGDHSPFGCYGGNMELTGGDIHPWELYHIVDELTGNIEESTNKQVNLTPSEEQEIQRMLEKKGYI